MIPKTRNSLLAGLLAFSAALGTVTIRAASPQALNHQGRVTVGGVNFDGTGQFKFAIVSGDGGVRWTNDGSSGQGGSAPVDAVSLSVTKGLYSSKLGDTTLEHMTALDSAIFSETGLYLRIWFNDGTHGFQQLLPDQALAATPYAFHAQKALAAHSAEQALEAVSFSGFLAGDVNGPQEATSIANNVVTGKSLTGFATNAGIVTEADTILSAFGKLNGNAALKAPLASPTFTGTVNGITKGMVGLGDVDNTSDLDKPVSTAQQVALDAQQAALDLKAPLASPTFTGTVSGITKGMVGLGDVENTSDLDKPVSTAQQTALDLKAPLDSPTFTGTVNGITKSMVGLGNADNTTDAQKPISNAQQAALNLKAPLASPTFTGAVGGITKSMVGLGNTDNTSDAQKPISTAQQTALDLKAPLASPTFTGTVTLDPGGVAAAPLRFQVGTNTSSAVLGALEFDGDQLYLTGNSANPVRRALAYADSQASSIPLSGITAAPAKPVLSWGNNDYGQTTVPALVDVASIAAGEYHSLALINDGSVVAWGDNGNGQVTIPSGLIGVTNIAAGSFHNLAVKSDGTVVAWGSNSSGQTAVPAGITTAVMVAAGANHSVVLLADGSVRAWGGDYYGQATVPPSLAGVTVRAIAAGDDHSLALTAAGTVVAWGGVGVGETDVPEGLSDVTAIAGGAHHSLALKSDGTVMAWGWDNAGQSTVPSDLTEVVKIGAGYGFSMALKTDGTLAIWGETADAVPSVPTSATEVATITAGARHAMVLRSSQVSVQVALLDQDNVFTGKLGIQRSPAKNALEVSGEASKSTAGNWGANSDRRIKTDIESISGALETLERVRLVDFRYSEDYLHAHPEIEDRRYPNVIAQEFAKVFPDDVKGSGELLADGSEILQVDTYPLTIYSAAAIQELHRENQKLRQKLAGQEERLRRLESLLNAR